MTKQMKSFAISAILIATASTATSAMAADTRILRAHEAEKIIGGAGPAIVGAAGAVAGAVTGAYRVVATWDDHTALEHARTLGYYTGTGAFVALGISRLGPISKSFVGGTLTGAALMGYNNMTQNNCPCPDEGSLAGESTPQSANAPEFNGAADYSGRGDRGAEYY